MGTVGDPKLDLAWALQGWPEDPVTDAGRLNYADITGMPGGSSLVEYYADRSGRQVDDIDYYLILARWKLAIVLEQGYQRAGDDDKLRAFGPVVLDLMERAAELAETSDYKGPVF
jgi:aminoglycoside phosphotransferase (APT) family kinase protein